MENDKEIVRDDKGRIIGGIHKIKWKVKEHNKGDGDFSVDILKIWLDGGSTVHGHFPNVTPDELKDLKIRLQDK